VCYARLCHASRGLNRRHDVMLPRRVEVAVLGVLGNVGKIDTGLPSFSRPTVLGPHIPDLDGQLCRRLSGRDRSWSMTAACQSAAGTAKISISQHCGRGQGERPCDTLGEV